VANRKPASAGFCFMKELMLKVLVKNAKIKEVIPVEIKINKFFPTRNRKITFFYFGKVLIFLEFFRILKFAENGSL